MPALITNTDTYNILKHLGLPFSQLNYLREQIDIVALEGTDYEQLILDTLTKLEAVALKLSEEQSNPNSALIRADVLEWEGGGKRSAGITAEYGRLKAYLANLLNIPLSDLSSTSGNPIGSGSMCIEVIL